jgi:hypothetical protein
LLSDRAHLFSTASRATMGPQTYFLFQTPQQTTVQVRTFTNIGKRDDGKEDEAVAMR